MDLILMQNELQAVAKTTLGIPYATGPGKGKYVNLEAFPVNLDCSGEIKYIYDKVRRNLNIPELLQLPDGSEFEFQKIMMDVESNEKAMIGDLAFFAHNKDPLKVYHVGMLYDAKNVIESREFDGREWTGKVLLRDRKAWEGWQNFIGYYRHPDLMQHV